MSTNVVTYLAYYYFYCMFGWAYETIEVSIRKKEFVNRGFMSGPWLPIYGFGAMIYLVVCVPLKDYPVLVFLSGMVTSTVMEYIAGALLLYIFKVRYWDYRKFKIQLHGHICLTASLIWGMGALLFVYILHEPVVRFMGWINQEVLSVATLVITGIMGYDFANSLRQALDLRRILANMEEMLDQLTEIVEKKSHGMIEKVSEYGKEMEKRLEEVSKKMLHRNPTASFEKYKELSDQIRSRFRKK
ncbi:MAG: putative ABC transporter permease [Lachnospiraceae bacterium]|nr:putative ABC transporter permease [Lachnospiraceae bacterium]